MSFIGYSMITLATLMILSIPFIIYAEVTSEKIILTKHKWNCTEYKTQMMLVGKIVIPQRVCVNYHRN